MPTYPHLRIKQEIDRIKIWWDKVDKAVDNVDKSRHLSVKPMLIGEYLHTIDQKNRLSVPSKFRKDLGKKVVLTRGLDKCLFLYAAPAWEELAKKLSTLPIGKTENRSFVRSIIAGATEVEIDALGRILLPDYLRVYANLTEAAQVIGLYTRAEIWSPEVWRKYNESAAENLEKVAEKLGEAGLY